MAFRVKKFSNISEFEWFLRGGIIGAVVNLSTGTPPGLWGLVGQTVTFTVPADSVTFVLGADPNGFLTPAEIKAQMEAAIAGIVVSFSRNRLSIIESTPTNGIDIGSAAAEPARGILGFNPSAGGHVIGKVINSFVGGAPPTTPYLVQLVSANNDSYTAIIME